MNRIGAAVLLYLIALAPAFAAYTPIYAGVQVDNISGSALLGYQVNKTYAIEAQYTKSDTHISQSGMNSDTYITTASLAALAMLPMKLNGGSAYFLFVKAGYARITKEESYYIPTTVTLTFPYSGTVTNTENRIFFGAGAQYDFYENINGRVGIDIVGDQRSVNLGAIFKF